MPASVGRAGKKKRLSLSNHNGVESHNQSYQCDIMSSFDWIAELCWIPLIPQAWRVAAYLGTVHLFLNQKMSSMWQMFFPSCLMHKSFDWKYVRTQNLSIFPVLNNSWSRSSDPSWVTATAGSWFTTLKSLRLCCNAWAAKKQLKLYYIHHGFGSGVNGKLQKFASADILEL